VTILVRVAVVTCSCGMFPLEQATHRTSGAAWQAAADHAALNPTKCQPRMFWDHVPAALVPSPKAGA
jgi:hypothetical protein